MFKTLTQGGQVHIHQLRMFKQIFVFGFLVALLSGGGCFIWSCWQIPSPLWRSAYEVTWAKSLLVTTPGSKHPIVKQRYTPPILFGNQMASYQRSCLAITQDPFLQEKQEEFKLEIRIAAYKSLFMSGLSFLLLAVFWIRRGGSHKEAKHHRGATFMPWQQLTQRLKREKQASDLMIKGLPFLKDKETSHFLVTGTTGAGKSNLFHTLLPQIRIRGNKAIVVDVTGDYVARYYNDKTDLILNPLDSRSLDWTPWADCHLDSHYDVLADAMIQPKGRTNADPFWDNASRAVFKTALRKMASQGCKNVEELYRLLLTSSDKEFCSFFKNTEAAPHASEDNEKTTSSIRSVLASQLEGLRQLDSSEAGTGFSLRKWIEDDQNTGWLFITARADQRQALIPLISAWVDITTNALMTLPQHPERRLWFVIDELIALQKLPSLQMGLAEARKYGGCFLVGFQGKPQLENLYGQKESDAMLDLFNTKLFFRCSEPTTQMWISKVLGDKEEAEPNENISYGANSMRDGVSLGRHTRQTPLILPTEFSQLKDLECYVKLPGDYPCTKLRTTVRPVPEDMQPPFILKPEKKREYTAPPPQNHKQSRNWKQNKKSTP